MASRSQDDCESKAGGGDSVLPAKAPSGDAGSSSVVDDNAKYGFQRSDIGKVPLVGVIHSYDRHIVLCYKSPEAWPPNLEESDSDPLPKLLAGEIKKWASAIEKKTRLTISEVVDGTNFSNGDVLIFPDKIRYRGLTHSGVEQFVDEVLKKNSVWLSSASVSLYGAYVFVCAHGCRDMRCGVSGPDLIVKFKEEISFRRLHGVVFVSPCSHIGGHNHAGNVIIFCPDENKNNVTGHWYGYVTPEDISILFEEHILKEKVVGRLWRGQMGLSVDEQKLRLQLNEGLDQNTCKEITESAGVDDGCAEGATPGVGDCLNVQKSPEIVLESSYMDNKASSSKQSCIWKLFPKPNWFGRREGERTPYAALAIVGVVTTFAIAYGCYCMRHG